jgi:enoyl-CoA hydratase/carnithine racemase
MNENQNDNQGQTTISGDRGQAANLFMENRGAVRILTLNRPEKRNALDTALTEALLNEIRAVDTDESVGCVVLTGAGPGFCAGADLSEFKGLRDPQAAEARAELTMQLHLSFSKLRVPVVTAINGAAMGGGAGLAIAGDLAVMAENAKLGYPETKHGIVAAIVLANLVRQVGRKAAFELVSLGEPIGAARALQLGLVNHVVPPDALLSFTVEIAEKLSAVSRAAMAETKRLFHEVADLPLAEALERGRDVNKKMRSFQK